MMVGNNDRQSIREKAPVACPAAPVAAPKPPQAATAPAQSTTPPAPQAAPLPRAPDPEQQAPEAQENPEPPPTPEQIRAGALGPWDFHTEKWEAAYIRRIDATMAALKTAGVPVIWVGLAPQRNTKTSRIRPISTRSTAAGPRRRASPTWMCGTASSTSRGGLRSKAPITKVRRGACAAATAPSSPSSAPASWRTMSSARSSATSPIAPSRSRCRSRSSREQGAKPGGPAQRPAVGPVIPLTASAAPPVEELMGGGRAPRQATPDPVASRVLTKGEPITAPIGRADDFAWPRGSAPIAEPVALSRPRRRRPRRRHQEGSRKGQPGAATAQRGVTDPQAAGDPKQAQQKRMRSARRAAPAVLDLPGHLPLSFPVSGLLADQRGSVVDPIRNLSTEWAHWRPSRIAHTTSDWPRRMSPAANTFVERGGRPACRP